MNNSQLLKPEAKAMIENWDCWGQVIEAGWMYLRWFRGMLTRDDGKGAYPLFSFKKTCLPLMKQIWLINIYIYIHSIFITHPFNSFHWFTLYETSQLVQDFFPSPGVKDVRIILPRLLVLSLINTRLRLLLLILLLLRNNIFFKGDTKAPRNFGPLMSHSLIEIHLFFKMCGWAYVFDNFGF